MYKYTYCQGVFRKSLEKNHGTDVSKIVGKLCKHLEDKVKLGVYSVIKVWAPGKLTELFFPAWFDHLEERFSVKYCSSARQVLLPFENHLPPAETPVKEQWFLA